METVNVNIETPEIRVDVVQNEPPVVVVNVERQVTETVDAPISRPVSIEAKAGRNGERGERGEKGDKGDAGEPGKDGENGKDGQRGERGEKGDRGDDGADGERGEKGIKGDKGDRGEKGERGEQGKEGKEGQRGRDGKDGAKGEKGDKGEPGERGEKGRDGKDGIGFPGPPGKQGPPGNSAPHTHPLSDIEQSGATDGQVPIWDEGAGEWIPGNAPGGGASIIEKTYAEMAAHIAADELTPGQWYNITDAAGTDLGFICLALTTNDIAVQGSGGFFNPDISENGDYSGVEAFTGVPFQYQNGIWSAQSEIDLEVITGAAVTWNGFHYQCINDSVLDGTNPETNTSAYTLLPKSTSNVGYIEAWDDVKYSFEDDEIFGRADKLRNVLLGADSVSGFQYGESGSTGNQCLGASISVKNIKRIRNNNVYAGAEISGISGPVQITANIFKPSSIFFNTETFDATDFSANEMEVGAIFGNGIVLESGVSVSTNNFLSNISISNKTFLSGIQFFGNTIGVNMTELETITESIIGKRAVPGFSDIPTTVDITGLTTLDITAAKAQYCGIINTASGNATESIDIISNFPTLFPFLLRPAAGLTLTVTGTAIAGIGAGQIALTTTDVVLDGTNGEWLELEADPNGGGFLREKNRSGTLI